MTEPTRREAADEAIADLSRKWLGIYLPPRDRDLGPAPQHVERITAFLRAPDGVYDRGELVVCRPVANRIVWQPFPEGSPRILTGPFRLTDSGSGGTPGSAARVVQLQIRDARLELRVLPRDLTRLRQAFEGQTG